MRAGAGFNATGMAMAAGPSAVREVHSAWHSPVPYLFGGLAAMLGLIAFALLILACSYWKLSGYLERDRRMDGEGEGKPEHRSKEKMAPVFEEKIVVIMAGDVKPTFLATPMSSRASSFGDNNSTSSGSSNSSSSSNFDDSHNKSCSNCDQMNNLDKKNLDGGLDEDPEVSLETQNQNQDDD